MARKRGKSKAKKERPLLAVQGVVRLHHSFIPAQAPVQTMTVVRDESVGPETLEMRPCGSEHEQVCYKAGYDVGPANPFPLNQVEADIARQREKVEMEREKFERLKEESEREKRMRGHIQQTHEIVDLVDCEKEDDNQTIVDHTSKDENDRSSIENQKEIDLSEDKESSDDDVVVLATIDNTDSEKNFPKDNGKASVEENNLLVQESSENVGEIACVADISVVVDEIERVEESTDIAINSDTNAANENVSDQACDEVCPNVKGGLTEVSAEISATNEATNNESTTNMETTDDVSQMALNVALEMESQRGRQAKTNEPSTTQTEVYSLDELVTLHQLQSAPVSGPQLPNEVEQSNPQSQSIQNKHILDSYWQFVRDRPKDFNGWSYLLQYVEYLSDIGEIRKAYNAFLTSFPYCYSYWQRYSELESQYLNLERSLAILRRGLEALPLSIELWLSYLEVFHKLYNAIDDFASIFREQFESAISTIGLDFNSDSVWSQYIEWEQSQGNLRNVTELYKRLIGTPTRLYNRHWDNFVAHVRDHHPRDILQYEKYEELRKQTCKKLDLVYRPDPEPFFGEKKVRAVFLPEDKLKSGMKERIVADLITSHEECEKAVEERMQYEDVIKVKYYDLKPLDLRQLKNWNNYLDFEMSRGDHDRIMVLFERALVPCANYEHFWIKYADYLEENWRSKKINHKKKDKKAKEDENELNRKARMAFDTGLQSVENIREKRCTWTLKGFKTKDKEGNEIMMAEEDSDIRVESELKEKRENIATTKEDGETNKNDGDENSEKGKNDENAINEKDTGDGPDKDNDRLTKENEEKRVNESDMSKSYNIETNKNGNDKNANKNDTDSATTSNINDETEKSGDESNENDGKQKSEDMPINEENKISEKDSTNDTTMTDVNENSNVSEKNDNDGSKDSTSNNKDTNGPEILKLNNKDTPNAVAKGEAAVRDVYRRGCLVHCSKKALIKLRWALFEESCGQIEKAKDILVSVNSLYPMLMECCMQLIDIDRRAGNMDKVEQHYRRLILKIPKERVKLRSWISMRLARFQHKARNNAEAALATLRSAVKKDADNPELYAQVVDICYQKTPIDTNRLMATFKLAIESKMSDVDKLEFVKRKFEMTQEFGDVRHSRLALRELNDFKKRCQVELKERARKRRQEQLQEEKEQNELAIIARANAQAALEFNNGQTDPRFCAQCKANMESELERTKSQNDAEEDGVVDLMDLVIPEEQEEAIKKGLEEKTKYKEVAPTWELNIETYGYGRKRKHYDPDYEHVESTKFREYERLEAQGYDEALKDDDKDKPRNIHAPGLGSNNNAAKKAQKLNPDDYIVQPKVPELVVASKNASMASKNGSLAPNKSTLTEVISFNLPPDVSDIVSKPVVNVPDWFLSDGGELLLSESTNGKASIRYWPKFLNEKGNRLMFDIVRKHCKWHQRQICIGNQWRYETRLVAWYGPCNYGYSGLHLEKNLNWEPRLLDMLKRINELTTCEFNACFLNLYRHGHDMCNWHCDDHPQLGKHPSIASVSLGVTRSFEMHHKTDSNFIRFPLKPGSLLLLEGATQDDWYHCVPQEKQVKEERINLNFRTMFSNL